MPESEAATHPNEAFSCSLPLTEMPDRLARWKALAEEALIRNAEPGRIVSTYPRREDLAARLRELIEAESACCPFLTFDTRETNEIIEAELQYPPEFESVVAMIVPG